MDKQTICILADELTAGLEFNRIAAEEAIAPGTGRRSDF